MKRADHTPAETAARVKCDLAGEVLRSFGTLHFPSAGRSMLPALWPQNELLGRVAYVIRAGRLIPVPAELSAIESVTAKIVRRSVQVARAMVFMHRLIRVREKSVWKDTVPCQS
jgi:hypothetical protein